MDSNIYCIIPARGGSKRIPRKNILNFEGKPMIAYPIGACIRSSIFKSIVVSTDDDEIAGIAKTLGAKVPRLRSPNLSADTTSTLHVVQDAISMLDLEKSPDAIIVCLYPTAVLINEFDLIDAINIFKRNGEAKPLITLTEYSHPIERAYALNSDGYSPINPENMQVMTQDFTRKWYDSGQFYIASAGDWMNPSGLKAPFIAKIFSSYEVSDIDTFEDLERAKILFQISAPSKETNGPERKTLDTSNL